jgi:hypothetical protein
MVNHSRFIYRQPGTLAGFKKALLENQGEDNSDAQGEAFEERFLNGFDIVI